MKIRLDEQDIDNLEEISDLTGLDCIGTVKDRYISEEDLLAVLDNIIFEYKKLDKELWEMKEEDKRWNSGY